MDYQLTDNELAKQYEFHIDEFIPKIEYIKSNDKIFLTHTEVPRQLEGKGIASSLVLNVLEDIQQKKLRLVPLCPFVIMYLRRHPEWNSLVVKE